MDAAALGRLREGLPLTVRELAGRGGVSHNTITMLENRYRTANPSTARKLAAARRWVARAPVGRRSPLGDAGPVPGRIGDRTSGVARHMLPGGGVVA